MAAFFSVNSRQSFSSHYTLRQHAIAVEIISTLSQCGLTCLNLGTTVAVSCSAIPYYPAGVDGPGGLCMGWCMGGAWVVHGCMVVMVGVVKMCCCKVRP